jgi:hypothetical protein
VYVRAGDVTGSVLLEDDLRPEAAPLLAAFLALVHCLRHQDSVTPFPWTLNTNGDTAA